MLTDEQPQHPQIAAHGTATAKMARSSATSATRAAGVPVYSATLQSRAYD